ncbi:MAG TPA: hypothetical protein VH418_08850 [Solirubrobacteraceae bacterium]|jgi:hypothetical protein
MRRTTIALVAAGATLGVAASPAAAFTARVTNPYFPLRSGMTWEYHGVKDGRRLVDLVRVTGRVRRIAGAPCAVVADWTWLDGKLAERTTDWYTQDRHGTVWYYGERTAELDRRGRVVSREGSWQAGRHGARPGVFMPAHPRAGRSFAQEHLPGHAEDHFRVITRHATVTVPFGTFRGRALLTHEWTPLEPGVLDGKWYVKGVGEVRESSLTGPEENAELVSFSRSQRG